MRTLKFKPLRDDVILPERAHPSDSGFDLYLPDEVILSREPRIVKLGFSMGLPPGHEGQIRPRSSMPINGVFVQFGTIDQDYRGEIGVVAWTNGPNKRLPAKSRIAQLVIARMTDVFVEVVHDLGDTERGSGGFGSTGR